jgi:hypothetical protein
MNGFKKIFPIFLSHYATFFAKMAEKKVTPPDEFHYQSKPMYLFQKHPVYNIPRDRYISPEIFSCSPNSCLSFKITLGLAPSCNFLATNTGVSGLLERVSGTISLPWYIIYRVFLKWVHWFWLVVELVKGNNFSLCHFGEKRCVVA